MSLMGFQARNHPQQVGRRGAISKADELETDPVLFAELHAKYCFTLDVAATEQNAKLFHYYTPKMNGLEQTWSLERVWCNPPYSDLGSWVAKAQWEAPTCPVIVMLVPANRTEQAWWQDYVEPYRDGRITGGPRTDFLRGRRRFIRPGEQSIGPNERPPFGSCLLIWGRADNKYSVKLESE